MIRVLRSFSCAVLLGGHVLFTAAGAQTDQTRRDAPELVQFGDVVDVDVVGGFEFDWRGTVSGEGYLNGFESYSDPIYALCRTETDIAADISRALSKILRDPKVVVRIVDRSGRALARIDGAIKAPTRFRILRPVRLRELIVMAGGFTDETRGDISIFRPRTAGCAPGPSAAARDNDTISLRIKIIDLLRGENGANVEIFSGDLITVERASPVYVIGAVASPGPLYAKSGLTVSAAIASAGGVTKDAGGLISIFRRDGLDTTTLTVDLGRIKSGETPDEVLKAFDIIDVASKGAARRKFPPVSLSDERVRREPPLKIVD